MLFGALQKSPFAKSITPDTILGTPTPMILSLAFVLSLWAAKLIYIDGLTKKIRKKPRDLVYKDLYFSWVYSEDGTLAGNCVYELENRGKKSINRLPYEGFVWFKQPAENSVNFRIIYRNGDVVHRFSEDHARWVRLEKFVDIFRANSGIDLSWSPKITPPISKSETILYEIELETPKTEVAAFEPQGSILGFPVRRYTDRARLTAKAPKGYKFVLLKPTVTVTSLETGENRPELEARTAEVVLTANHSSFDWEVEAPAIGHRYWVHFRFEKK